MTELYSEWRDFYAEKVRSWMSLEEIRAECGKLQTADATSPEVLLIHAMHLLERYEQRNEAMLAEVKRLRADRDSWEQQASDRVADWYAEHLRAEQLEEALREWWKAHRPVGWTEDQHRSCPHVNLATDAEKALAAALLERPGDIHHIADTTLPKENSDD